MDRRRAGGDAGVRAAYGRDMKRYRTIVADPPWPYTVGPTSDQREGGADSFLPYPTMTVEEISALPVRSWSVPDTRPDRLGSHLYLWATTSFLTNAFDVSRAWGFEPSAVLVWCKPPSGRGFGGTFGANVEFVLFGRRGAPRSKAFVSTRWFEWPRGRHSEKPDAFYDLVEHVSEGPYLELFARRARLGDWDYWGNESLGTASLGEAA